MNRIALRDNRFHIIGYIDTESNGKQVARDARFHIVGHYDPHSNVTRNAQFHIVGHGNLLTTLIGRG